MKKLFAYICVLTMSISIINLYGCGESVVGAGSNFTGELETNVTIRILEEDTAIEQGFLSELLDAFNKEYKDYGITAVDANMDQYTDLATNGPLGYGPDVIYQANDVLMEYVDGKHILPLPVEDMEVKDKISKEAWDAYAATVDGNDYTMAVPVNIQGPVLYYRKDMLPNNWTTQWDDNSNNIPDMVENWNDMYAYSLSIRNADSSKYGYMKALSDSYFSSGYLFSYGGYVFGNNDKDDTDIGFSAGESYLGAEIILDLASVMNQEASDYELSSTLYSSLANKTIFATMTTPDVKIRFEDAMKITYKQENPTYTDEQIEALIEENLVIVDIPLLPKNGDITDSSQTEFIPAKMMGGVNGYAISSYTSAPNASLAFIEFATSYEMISRRNELIDIVPAREDVASASGGLSEIINQNLDDGNIYIMPSISAVDQIWSPTETFFADLVADAFRADSAKKYSTRQAIIAGLNAVDQKIYDAIHTLS